MMFFKMVGINVIFLINTRFREIEVQIAENQAEITFNIFRKLKVTKIFRNVFLAIVIILQVAGTIVVDSNTKGFYGIRPAQQNTLLVIYGSYFVSISIILMFLGYMLGFVIQYRSMMRLIQFLIKNKRARCIIFIFSLIVMVVYIFSVFQALIFFWGIAASP